MELEELRELWEKLREQYQKDFGVPLIPLDDMLSVYAYHKSIRSAGCSMTTLINETTHSSQHASKLKSYIKEEKGITPPDLNTAFEPALTEWHNSLKQDDINYYVKTGKGTRREYEQIQKDYLRKGSEDPYRQKIDLQELEKQKENKEENKEENKKEDHIDEKIDEKKDAVEEIRKEADQEDIAILMEEPEAEKVEKALPEQLPQEKEEPKAQEQPVEREQIDPLRQSILDAFDAIRDTKVSRFGTKHGKEFDAVWDAVNEYEAAVYKASLNKQEIAQDVGARLYGACKNYLLLHLQTKKGVQSIDGQGTEDGRLRKQAIVRMLEIMETGDGLQEFNWAAEQYAADQTDNRKKISLDFDQLKRSLAEGSKIRDVPLEQRNYAELEQRIAERKFQRQTEAADFSALSLKERKKQREKNGKQEFYQGYRAFLNQYPLLEKEGMIRRINSNEISVLKNMKKEFGKDDEKLKKYLEHRIQNLQIIKRTADRAEKNLENRKTEEPEITTRDDGSISRIMMKNVEQPMMQKTSNGCWAVALSSLLKYRGVDLDQTVIRSYRPKRDLAFANSDSANNIANYTDLIQKVMPNAAVNEIEVYQQNLDGVKWTDEKKAEEKETVKQKLKTALLSAMGSDKGPVAFLCGNHYRTVLGLEEREIDGVKTDCVTMYDPLRAEKVTLTLDRLAEQSYLPGKMEKGTDAKGNPTDNWMGEGFSFTMQWLKDLTDSKGNLLPDSNLESKGVAYDQDGKLTTNRNAVNKTASTSDYKAVSWRLNEDMDVRTYLPAKMTLLQKKAEKEEKEVKADKERIPNFLGEEHKKIKRSTTGSQNGMKLSIDGPVHKK